MPTQKPNPPVRIQPPTGYEPAKGFPDPNAKIKVANMLTHRPNPNGGTICGVHPVPMNAAAYNMEAPTCPDCKKWLDAVRAHTYAHYGAPKVHGSSALEPEEPPPPSTTAPPKPNKPPPTPPPPAEKDAKK